MSSAKHDPTPAAPAALPPKPFRRICPADHLPFVGRHTAEELAADPRMDSRDYWQPPAPPAGPTATYLHGRKLADACLAHMRQFQDVTLLREVVREMIRKGCCGNVEQSFLGRISDRAMLGETMAGVLKRVAAERTPEEEERFAVASDRLIAAENAKWPARKRVAKAGAPA